MLARTVPIGDLQQHMNSLWRHLVDYRRPFLGTDNTPPTATTTLDSGWWRPSDTLRWSRMTMVWLVYQEGERTGRLWWQIQQKGEEHKVLSLSLVTTLLAQQRTDSEVFLAKLHAWVVCLIYECLIGMQSHRPWYYAQILTLFLMFFYIFHPPSLFNFIYAKHNKMFWNKLKWSEMDMV